MSLLHHIPHLIKHAVDHPKVGAGMVAGAAVGLLLGGPTGAMIGALAAGGAVEALVGEKHSADGKQGPEHGNGAPGREGKG